MSGTDAFAPMVESKIKHAENNFSEKRVFMEIFGLYVHQNFFSACYETNLSGGYVFAFGIRIVYSIKSFVSVLVTEGNGTIDGIEIKKGDSLFVPAGYGTFTIKGNLEIIVTRV